MADETGSLFTPSPQAFVQPDGDISFFIGDVGQQYNAGYAAGYAAGQLIAPQPFDDSAIAFLVQDVSGPLTGLTPTWLCYWNVQEAIAQTPPAISAVGGGSYKFTPSGNTPAGIIDVGSSSALPRYFVYAPISAYKVFAAFDINRDPLAGQTPTWVSLKKVSDGSNYTQPAITALGFGLYRTAWTAEHTTGVIDLGSGAYPRYIHYDSEISLQYLDGYVDGERYGFSSQREEIMEPISLGETDDDKKTITFSIYTSEGLPASGDTGEGAVCAPGAAEKQTNRDFGGWINAGGTFAHIADGKYKYTFSNTEVQSSGGEGNILFRVKVTGYRVMEVRVPIRSATSTADALATVATYVDTEVAAIKAKTDNLPASPANEVTVAAIKAKTDNLPSDPADASDIAAAFAATTATIIAAIPTAAAVRDAILDAARSGHIAVGSVGEALALSASLLQGNFFIDNVTNTDNGPTVQRLRCFLSAAAMAGVTPGGTGQGEFATFDVATTYSGPNKIVTHKVTQQ